MTAEAYCFFFLRGFRINIALLSASLQFLCSIILWRFILSAPPNDWLARAEWPNFNSKRGVATTGFFKGAPGGMIVPPYPCRQPRNTAIEHFLSGMRNELWSQPLASVFGYGDEFD